MLSEGAQRGSGPPSDTIILNKNNFIFIEKNNNSNFEKMISFLFHRRISLYKKKKLFCFQR